MFENLLQDVRHSMRRLWRSPSFAIGAVLILAIGIGANTTMFAVMNSVLLQPLGYRAPERLYSVKEVIPQWAAQYPEIPANARHFLEWQRHCSCFEDVAMADTGQWNLTGNGEAERLPAARVTANFFSVLGVSARLGRTFVAGEEQNDDRVVVLSDGLWRTRFGANPAVLGQGIELDGVRHVVVGVLPPDFRYRMPGKLGGAPQERVDVYKPWRIAEQRLDWVGSHNYPVVARLPAGKTEQQALAEFTALQAEITQNFEGPDRALTLTGTLTPLKEEVVARGRAGILLLLAAVATVLLIACLNLGNLMLIRTIARGHETAIRRALGAAGTRIFRGILIESLVIASCGALLGVVVAFDLVHVFAALAPNDLPRVDEVRVDKNAVAFAVLVTIGATLMFGLAPALQATRASPQDSLRGTGRSLRGAAGGSRPREWLVAAETGLSVALLIVAGLLIASFVRLDAVERGYDAQNVLTADLSLPAERYPDRDARRRFYDDLVTRLEAQSGVVAAGATAVLPLRGDAWSDIVTIEGDDRPLSELPLMAYRSVSPNYLAAIGTTLRAGRAIRASDDPRRVAVVSYAAAARLWHGENPIGKRFRRAVPTEPAFEVIGVANDVRAAGLDRDPPPIVYVALWERSPAVGSIAVRTTSEPLGAVAMLREAVKSIDPNVPVSRVDTMARVESDSTAQRRFQTLLVIVFAACALLLAALGIYGVVGYSTARRTNEIGLRLALGATAPKILALVLREGLRPVAVGLAAGIVAAMLLGRLVSALLFSVAPTDPVTFATVAIVVTLVALLACWIPARRAARLAPLDALRYE